MKKSIFILAVLLTVVMMTSEEVSAQWTEATTTVNKLKQKNVTFVYDITYDTNGSTLYATNNGVYRSQYNGPFSVLTVTSNKKIIYATRHYTGDLTYFADENIAYRYYKGTTSESAKRIDVSNKVGKITGMASMNGLIIAGTGGTMRCVWNNHLQKWDYTILNQINISAMCKFNDNNILLASQTGTCLKMNKNSMDAAVNFNTGLPSGTKIYRFVKLNNKIYAKTSGHDSFDRCNFYVLKGTTWEKVTEKINGLHYVYYNNHWYGITAIVERAGKSIVAVQNGGSLGMFYRNSSDMPAPVKRGGKKPVGGNGKKISKDKKKSNGKKTTKVKKTIKGKR